MISYSDYILANKPWAYWPLNDPSLVGIYNEDHLLMDCTGNERHLTIKNGASAVYQIPMIGKNDCLPVLGISIASSFSVGDFSYISEGSSPIYFSKGQDAHVNDTQLENQSYNVTHNLYRKKIRAEVLVTLGSTFSIGRIRNI
jgi:hypothetical protein